MAEQYADAASAYIGGPGWPSAQMLMKAQADASRYAMGAALDQPSLRPVHRELEDMARDISILETTWRQLEERLSHVLAPEETAEDTLAKGQPEPPASPVVYAMSIQRRAIRMLNVSMQVALAKLEV